MSDKHELPQTPDEAREVMDPFTFAPPSMPEKEAALIAQLPPPGSGVIVVRSLRLPLDLDEAVAAATHRADLPESTWIRPAIEIALAAQSDDDQPILIVA